MTAPISLLIVDDHKMVREGLKAFIAPIPDMVVVGEARDGVEAVELASQLKPDVMLLDLVMPRKDGIETAREVREANLTTRILMITSFAESERVMAGIYAGASGYLLKDSSPQELEAAIRAVYQGGSFLAPAIAHKVIQNITQPPKDETPKQELTPRELDILKLVAEGKTNPEISQILFLSISTVRTHIWHMMNKLQLENRTQLALYAVREGINSLPR